MVFYFHFCILITHVFFPFLATSSKPTVFPLMQCGSGTGDTVTLGCFATGFTPSSLTYTWSKVEGGEALTNFIQYPPVQKDDKYTGVSQIQVSKRDWDAMKSFKCVATHASGNGQAVFKKERMYAKTCKSFLSS